MQIHFSLEAHFLQWNQSLYTPFKGTLSMFLSTGEKCNRVAALHELWLYL